jgi:hypothetical protein
LTRINRRERKERREKTKIEKLCEIGGKSIRVGYGFRDYIAIATADN